MPRQICDLSRNGKHFRFAKINAFSIIFCYNAPKNLRQGNFMNKKVRVEKTIDLYKIPLSAPIVALAAFAGLMVWFVVKTAA
ncbi:hypothetical protein C6B36_08780 [Helicobacter cinaedi]|nr:hypothetical protein C6B36_08780 [Helicobacter cinaedi]